MKASLAVAALGSLPLTLVLGLAMLGATSAPAVPASSVDACFTTGAVTGLDTSQSANARIVTAIAERDSGPQGAVVAVMTALTESGMRVLGNPTVAGSGGSVQGMGADHDSVGLFQQRASWGTVAVRLDPSLSTGLFVKRLIAIPGWRGELPWLAAQRVQKSAWDGDPRSANHESADVGGNYRANLARAQHIVAEIDVDAAKARCGAMSGGLPANPAPGSHGLPASYVIPPNASMAQSRVIAFAIGQLDKPYVFGAAGPAAFDCSGLTLAAWRQAGVTLPHDAAAQSHMGHATTAAALLPGDLVFVPGDDGSLAAPGHVGIFIGAGLVLNAADEQIGIRVQTYANFVSVGHGLADLRHIA